MPGPAYAEILRLADEQPGRLAALAMDLAGPSGLPLCEALLRGEAVPLARLDPEAVKRYGLAAPSRDGRVTLPDFNLVPKQLAADGRPFALEADEFRAEVDPEHVPLLGSNGDAIIPAQGLVVVAGQPGVGKTTLLLDLVYHLASGQPWLGMTCPRPLNVLLVENEGPEHMFRAKIERKAQAWPHERPGRIWVQTWRWGLFSFADSEACKALQLFQAENPVDIVVGDPLASLGPQGVGSPDETRRFALTLLGLDLPVAYVFAAHFRKEPSLDEVNQLSGAWAGHLDTLLLLKPTRHDNEVRLSFPKTRWTDAQRKPTILGYVRNTQGFDLLGEEGGEPMQVHEMVLALSPDKAMTPSELASAAGMRRVSVEAHLAANPHLFQSLPGAELGRPRAKLLWRLVPIDGTSSDKRELVPAPDKQNEAGHGLEAENPLAIAKNGPARPGCVACPGGGGITYPPSPLHLGGSGGTGHKQRTHGGGPEDDEPESNPESWPGRF